MTAAQSAEAQARLNVLLHEVKDFFQSAGARDRSLELMENFIEKHLNNDFLELAENYGKCMAFINHDELVNLLLKCYLQMIDGFIIERKLINKRLRLLKEDKKADPEVIARIENALSDLDNKKALATVESMRLRAMDEIPLEKFMDSKFDGIKFTKEKIAHIRQLLKTQQREAALASRK